MQMAETEHIRIRVKPDLKQRWDKVLADRKISQQEAVVALMEWASRQEPILQTMLFGQVPESDQAELARIVLRRLGQPAKLPTYTKLIDSVGGPKKTGKSKAGEN